MLSGIIGLFIGSVVLALGYKLLMAWIEGDDRVEHGEGVDAVEASG